MSRTSSPFSADVATTGLACRVVASEFELEAHFHVRRDIFVHAQGLFENDRDEYDVQASTLHVVAFTSVGVIGAVRLYPLSDDGIWKGDRLAVLPGARAGHAGAELVRCAVRLAGARGGRQMLALVQQPVVRFFERLGWTADGPLFHYRGVVHQPMRIALRPPQLGEAA